MTRIVYRRYPDGVPSNAAFFLVYGGCHLCRDGNDGCHRLVWNPIGTLLDRKKWPDHWNQEVWRGLVERWAAQHYVLGAFDGVPKKTYIDGLDPRDPDMQPSGGELAFWAWQNMWPIPLGRRALVRSIDAGRFPSESEPRRLFNIVPFGGDEYGALILLGVIGESLVEFFGLAEPVLDAAGGVTGYRAGEAVFRITGFDLAESDLRQFVANARRWWATFSDHRIAVPTGRPPGPERDRNFYSTHYRELVRQLKRQPRQHEFLNFLRAQGETLNRTTLRRNLEEFNLWPWDRFVAATARADNRR